MVDFQIGGDDAVTSLVRSSQCYGGAAFARGVGVGTNGKCLAGQFNKQPLRHRVCVFADVGLHAVQIGLHGQYFRTAVFAELQFAFRDGDAAVLLHDERVGHFLQVANLFTDDDLALAVLVGAVRVYFNGECCRGLNHRGVNPGLFCLTFHVAADATIDYRTLRSAFLFKFKGGWGYDYRLGINTELLLLRIDGHLPRAEKFGDGAHLVYAWLQILEGNVHTIERIEEIEFVAQLVV